MSEKELTVEDQETIRELASGAFIQCIDHGGYDGYSYELRRPGKSLTSSVIIRLLDEGWIYSCNTAYRITDEGKKAYLRSTDELRDGEMILNGNLNND